MRRSERIAVVTICIGNRFSSLSRLTTPFMEKYAKKIGADFHIIRNISKKHCTQQYSAYWAKFELRSFLEQYDRILYLDLDTLIWPHCPNIFDEVSACSIGAVFESDYGVNLEQEILEIQSKQGELHWRTDYFNVGVMVLSKDHKDMFRSLDTNIGSCLYPEQTQINYNFQKYRFDAFHLNFKFNHMKFLNVDNKGRLDSYICHYAGIRNDAREMIIEKDIECYMSGNEEINSLELCMAICERLNLKEVKDLRSVGLMKDELLGL